MKNTPYSFGHFLYEEIEKNEYLNELYSDILFNYSISLFSLKNKPKLFNINDALQFADILSKSNHATNSDHHKIWGQEIISLLDYLYPKNKIVQHFLGSVLTANTNYRGLKIKSKDFKHTEVLENTYTELSKSLLAIPGDAEEFFFRSQKIAYDNISLPAFSYSGPTSLGKSFIMRMFIKKQILDGIKQNFAIIVPTKALINEVYRKVIADIKDNLGKQNYKVIKFADQLILKKGGNFIFVLTPERLLYLLISEPKLIIDYLFIDEAHKISSKDKRSAFYYKVIGMFAYRTKPHFIFASPNIPNPDIYLNLLPDKNELQDNSLAISYSPVSQIKYLIDIPGLSISYYNPQSHDLIEFKKMEKVANVLNIVARIGIGKQNLIYVSSTEQAVDFAREYSERFIKPCTNEEQAKLLLSLSNDIKSEVHKDCFLVETVKKGVAYHIGYLPANIRLRIEELYNKGFIHTLFCTSTLIEGVNLPADNLFITSYWNGSSHLTQVEFKNLVGRVGRIDYNLYGNVFLMRLPEKPGTKSPRNNRKKFEELLINEVPKQELSVVNELNKKQKNHIVDCLVVGNISLLSDDDEKAPEGYELMRKFAQILLKDILNDRKSFVVHAFKDFLNDEKIDNIKKAFEKSKNEIDDDINTSVDQTESLREAIADETNPLSYPEINPDGKIEYEVILSFLKRLLCIFKWDKYEKSTLGKACSKMKKAQEQGIPNKCPSCNKYGDPYHQLGWYAVILSQWLQSKGISQIIDSSMADRKSKGGWIGYGDKTIPYDDDNPVHRNVIISDTLKAIEQVVLFSLANYLLRFSNEYKRYHKKTTFKNDWYEFVEYGTTNELVIYFQRSGFSREVALWICKSDYIINKDSPIPQLKKSIKNCSNQNVQKEVEDMLYNAPELFVD